MKKESVVKGLLIMLALIMALGGCSSGTVKEQQIVAKVQRGNLEIKVRSDGNIEMPQAVSMYFDTATFTSFFSARIREIYVQKGDIVHAGALLAKLDNTGQKLALESAQYALELAINNVVQSVCCGVGRYPSFYADSVALLRYQFATEEAGKAKTHLSSGKLEKAAEQLALAKYDIEGAKAYYTSPDYKELRIEFNSLDQAVESSPDLGIAIARLTFESDFIAGLQQQIKNGQYATVNESLGDLLMKMSETHTVIKRITHLPGSFTYPDTPTTYTVVREIATSLDILDEMAASESFDPVKFSERLSMARHDIELSSKILEENISTYRLGLNLKALRDYNINIQMAVINLERAKQALLKTELIAPFDGRVVDVNLQAGDMITQRYAVTGLPIDSYVIKLVNTGNVRMAGVVDEIDVLKIKTGQLADVTVDALPGKIFKGTVKFISPFGPIQSRSIPSYGSLQSTLATYRLEISLDPKDALYLAAGQTAEAELLVDRHTGVLSVPNSALMGKAGEYYVRVLKDEKTNLIVQRPVQIGLQNDTRTEVTGGLTEGDMVLLQKSIAPARSAKK